MKIKSSLLAAVAVFSLGALPAGAAVVSLSAGTTNENFNTISTTAAAGWDVRTGASTTTLGTVGTYIATAGSTTDWGSTAGGFKNLAAASTGVGSVVATQTAATDRALGIRQTGALGDPGAAFNYNFSSSGLTVSNITIDLQMLSVQTRSTTWSIQYGIGATPTSFSTLATYADTGVFGSTTFAFTTADFGTALNNIAEAWFRIVALTATTGSGSRDSFGIDNFSITTAAIPEPDAAAIFGAIGLFGLFRRRR